MQVNWNVQFAGFSSQDIVFGRAKMFLVSVIVYQGSDKSQ